MQIDGTNKWFFYRKVKQLILDIMTVLLIWQHHKGVLSKLNTLQEASAITCNYKESIAHVCNFQAMQAPVMVTAQQTQHQPPKQQQKSNKQSHC